MPTTPAERSREYRRRKNANKIKKIGKSSTERVREFRARQKNLFEEQKQNKISNANNNVADAATSDLACIINPNIKFKTAEQKTAEVSKEITPCTSIAIEKDPLTEENTETSYKHFDHRKCRTCFRVFNVDENAKDLADEKNDELLYKIAVIAGVLIQCQNGMSPFMCSVCVGDLHTAYEFRETCIRTEKQLREEHSVPILTIIKKDNTEFMQTQDEETLRDIDVNEESISQSFGENDAHLFIDSDLANDKKPQTAKSNSVKPSSSTTTLPTTETTCQPVSKSITISKSKTQKSREPKPRKQKILERKPRPSARTLPLKYVCDKCGAAFRVKCNLDLHILRHTLTKNFPCPECPKEFYAVHSRNIHIRVRHKGELPFACQHCSKSFGSHAMRRYHTNKEHAEPTQIKNARHFCSYCNKSYATKYLLNMHVNVHRGLTPFKCKACDMEFPNLQTRKKHELTHASKRPFECDICEKGFFSHSKLKEHGRVHTGERPYGCDICSVSFRYKFNLSSHRRSKMHKKYLENVGTEDIIME